MAVNDNSPVAHSSSLPTQTQSGQEKQEVVKCLPRGTCEYEFQGIENAEETLDGERCKGARFVLFSHVAPRTEDEISERLLSKGSSYYPGSELLLLKMPLPPHERATAELDGLLISKLSSMGSYQGLALLGSADVQGSNRTKSPDRSYRPQTLPHGRSTKWPTLVFETGYSESRLQLERDARWWLGNSSGEVQIVLTIDVARTKREIIVQRWESVQSYHTRNNPEGFRQEAVQSVSISRSSLQTTATITNSPLIIPFQQLFLRRPTAPETDIIFPGSELESWAEGVWASQGL